MKEQRITVETAKLAKQKGWDGDMYDKYNDPIPHKIYTTQSLLQKWLREVHNIHVWCVPHINDGMYYGANWYKNDYNKGNWNAFKTYEKALEAGLQEALKLI